MEGEYRSTLLQRLAILHWRHVGVGAEKTGEYRLGREEGEFADFTHALVGFREKFDRFVEPYLIVDIGKTLVLDAEFFVQRPAADFECVTHFFQRTITAVLLVFLYQRR